MGVIETLATDIGAKTENLSPFITQHIAPFFDNPSFASYLKDTYQIQPKIIRIFLTHVAKGIQYVHDQHGTYIDGLRIVGSIQNQDGSSQAVPSFGVVKTNQGVILFINPTVLKQYQDSMLKKQNRFNYHLQKEVTPDQQLALLGVEEAYHAVQYHQNFERTEPKKGDTSSHEGRLHFYQNDSFEKAAGEVIKRAAKDFGIGLDLPPH